MRRRCSHYWVLVGVDGLVHTRSWDIDVRNEGRFLDGHAFRVTDCVPDPTRLTDPAPWHMTTDPDVEVTCLACVANGTGARRWTGPREDE